MKTIVIASAKGGTGKTTLTAALAARAAVDRPRVTMIDFNDDQGSLTQWWTARGKPDNPHLAPGVDDVADAATVLRQEGEDWLFIDTAPLRLDDIEDAIAVADLVLIPVRASLFDIAAVKPVVEFSQAANKNHAFVLMAVDQERMETVTKRTVATLERMAPVLSSRISYHQGYVIGLPRGRSGAEADANLRAEMEALWAEVGKLLAQPEKPKGSRYGRR